MVDKKREEPAPVEPVEVGGVRYEAVLQGGTVGIPQDGGVVAAIEAPTGRLLWAVRVYETEHDPEMEEDKQDVFIKSLSLDPGGTALIIVNEHGNEYRLDLETRKVTPVRIGDR